MNTVCQNFIFVLQISQTSRDNVRHSFSFTRVARFLLFSFPHCFIIIDSLFYLITWFGHFYWIKTNWCLYVFIPKLLSSTGKKVCIKSVCECVYIPWSGSSYAAPCHSRSSTLQPSGQSFAPPHGCPHG